LLDNLLSLGVVNAEHPLDHVKAILLYLGWGAGDRPFIPFTHSRRRPASSSQKGR
jgi:hypothetical protein